ncbi:MAG TPA: serine/threonine-protein kinase [Ktedonobacterales bacterium]
MEWSDLIGQQLGQYELLSELGKGAYAHIYQAFQPRLRRHVAVKVLRIDHADQAGFIQRFEHIAQAIAQLNHPNILSIYDFGEEGGLAYIVMQSVTGGSYKSRLGKPMAVGEAVTPIVQMARALHHAHQRGVLHMDVRPQNILIDQENSTHLLLTDFSLSQLFQDEYLARTGMPIGSPAYLAPEQIEGGRLTARTDIYALGALLFEALAGQPAFSGPNAPTILNKHLHEPPPYLRGFNPAAPRELAHIVSRALAKRPEERYESAEEFARALDPYRDARDRHHRLSLMLDDLNLPADDEPEGGVPAPSRARTQSSDQPGKPPSGPDQARHTLESAPAFASHIHAQRRALEDFPIMLGHEPEVQPRIPLLQTMGANVLRLARRAAGNTGAGHWLDHQLHNPAARLGAGIASIALALVVALSVTLLAATAPTQGAATSSPQLGQGVYNPPTPTDTATPSPTATATPSPTATATPSGPSVDPNAAAVFANPNIGASADTNCQNSTGSVTLPAGRTFYVTLCFNSSAISGGGNASVVIMPKGATTAAAQEAAYVSGNSGYYWFRFAGLGAGSYQVLLYWNGSLGYITSLTVN